MIDHPLKNPSQIDNIPNLQKQISISVIHIYQSFLLFFSICVLFSLIKFSQNLTDENDKSLFILYLFCCVYIAQLFANIIYNLLASYFLKIKIYQSINKSQNKSIYDQLSKLNINLFLLAFIVFLSIATYAFEIENITELYKIVLFTLLMGICVYLAVQSANLQFSAYLWGKNLKKTLSSKNNQLQEIKGNCHE